MGRLVSHSDTEWRTDPAEASWHRRARRNRQVARAVLAVDRARQTLAAHHGGGLHLPRAGDMGRPYVACLKCKEASWVYVGNGVTDCHRCGLAFPHSAHRERPRPKAPPAEGARPLRLHSPEAHSDRALLDRLRVRLDAADGAARLDSQHPRVPADGHHGAGHDEWPPLSRNLADKAKKSGDVIAASLDALLSSGKCEEFGEVLRNIKASVCTPAPVKHGAAVSGASQRVCIALKVKEAAVAKRKSATDEMAKLLHWMEELGRSCPDLDAAVKAADAELHLARAENEKAVDSAVGPLHADDLEGGSGSSAVVRALQSQVRELQSKLSELSSARGSGDSLGVDAGPGRDPVLGASVQGGEARGRKMSPDRADGSEGKKPRKDRSRSGRRDVGAVPEGGADADMREGPECGSAPDDHQAQIKRAQELAEGAGVMPASAMSDQSGG